ncbi:MAG TPA: hypothetical protein VNT26_11375, partial [Candidatus Sulfotelmatobacter sp.]|nr:hypothetical protein [Candidatus Sulfotelmatobacter sp.]
MAKALAVAQNAAAIAATASSTKTQAVASGKSLMASTRTWLAKAILAGLFMSLMPLSAQETKPGATNRITSLTRDDVLSIREGRFFLDGKPFAEISFNKFDLLWQLYDQLAAGKALDAANPLVQAQEKA